METLLYCCAAIIVTVLVAIPLCHYRFARKQRILFGTVLASAVLANVAVFLAMAFYQEGWGLFHREAWTGGKGGWGMALVFLGVVTAMCVLPALGVAIYYQRRDKRATS